MVVLLVRSRPIYILCRSIVIVRSSGLGRRMMTTDSRTRMLETTAKLLQLRGYHGTGLNEILAESGAPRGSLYFHFPGGKDQLVLEATRLSVERITRRRREVLATAETPAAALRTFAEGMAQL